ncbi:MAG: RsmB/NOP family class I SAM-dependent RNA methyltransferase [Aigarchaeota archaeon]|nr:RsmB/NOP family class I SAM-dependent RNA methyltransferase [Aigarchaeota archaeon]MDW8092552.1 RsmB/NOP family class I SAM-dependent RNA methyltransferase [Nitrososphaerota archaeon]
MSRPIELSDDLSGLMEGIPDMEVELYREAITRPLPECARVNTLKMQEAEVVQMLEERGWTLRPVPWARYGYFIDSTEGVGSSVYHMAGLIYIQGPLSMLPAESLDVRPGDRVLDLCAAPGSKSTQMAQLMENRGVLVCNEVSTKRIRPLISNLQRFGVLNHLVTQVDGRRFSRFASHTFDRVLVDVPCSSLGIAAKDWSLVRTYSKTVSERLSRLQLSLLISAFDCLREGGLLVYSTCTVHPLENEWPVSNLLEERDSAEVLSLRPSVLKSRSPLEEWEGLTFRSEVKRCFKAYPYDNWAEGFFVALIRRGR